MNRTKQQELKIAYQRVMEVTLLDLKAPLRWIDDYVAENACGYGTAADEKFNSRDEFRWVIINSRKQSKNISLKAKIITKYKPSFFGEYTAAFRDQIIVNIGKNKQAHVLQLLVGTTYSYIDNKWQLISLNASLPDDNTSSTDTFHIADNEKKLRALEQTIEERTAEILEKNKELQIETALEKVRAVAMGMKKADDMLNICKTISQQLIQLGVKEIRNVQTAIFYENRGTYMNYEYYAKHDKTFITEVDFKNHKIQLAFAKKMLKGPNEEMQEHLKGKKLQDWYKYQKSTNQFADKYLLKADSVNYYWYSLGPVALGISTYYPLTKDETNLFKRFLKVFELAYRRYLDIEKAEAQTREAQIEVALERVRSRSLAMHKSEEIMDVATIVAQQLQNLQLEFDSYTILIIGDTKMEYWIANQSKTYKTKLIENFNYENPSVPNELFFRNYKKQLDFSRCYTFKEKNEHWKTLFKNQPDFKAIPEERKQYILKQPCYNIAVSFKQNIAGVFVRYNSKEYSVAEKEVLKRFNEAFSQAYVRFLDLQKAEAQAREAQIEAALERVRSRTMGLRHSDELEHVMAVVFEETRKLGLDVYESSVYLRKGKSNTFSVWAKSIADDQFFTNYDFSFFDHKVLNEVLNNLDNNIDVATFNLHGSELTTYLDFYFSIEEFKNILPATKATYYALENVYVAHVYFQHGFLEITSVEPLPLDIIESTKKFALVIDLAYTRFLDLQTSEAQAKEARVELALERVRSKTMAMQHSSQLREIAATTLEQLQSLGFKYGAASIVIMHAETGDMTWWISGFGNDYPTSYENYYFEHPFYLEQLNNWKEGKKYAVMVCEGEAKKMYDKYIFSETEFAKIPIELQKIMRSFEKITFSNAYMRHGALSWSTEPLSADYARILQRFASVFEQSYTRFLDLQKAEAQAREAEIELALERVRARTMAMQHSNELSETATLLFKQVLDLGINAFVSAFHIWQEDDISTICWASGDTGGIQPPIRIPHTVEPFHKQIYEARQRGDNFFMIETEGNDLAEAYRFLYSLIDGRKVLANIEDAGFPIPKSQATHCAFFLQGYIMFNTYQPVPEAYDIFQRFGKVFEQTYTRFLDLQKAEAQAREAQIESALERVRSRSMAMQKSTDLLEVIKTITDQLIYLGIEFDGSDFVTVNPNKSWNMWICSCEENFPFLMHIPYFNHRGFIQYDELIESKSDFFTYIYSPEESTSWMKHFFEKSTPQTALPDLTQERTEQLMQPTSQAASVYIFDRIMFAIFRFTDQPFTDVENAIFKRVSKVFEQAYTRFLDLQKAEAQAREAQIELGLERVRSRAMAMQHSNEIAELVDTVFKELTNLHFLMNRCQIMIIDQDGRSMRTWMANLEIDKTPNSYLLKLNDHPYFVAFIKAWREKQPIWIYNLKGDEKDAMVYYVFTHTEFSNLPVMVKNGMINTKSIFFNASFNNFGSMQVDTLEPLSKENLEILNRFGNVFDYTYKRFNDLQKAEAQAEIARLNFIQIQEEKQKAEAALLELQATQKQLIQSEKMASLGELTAGIAHEIQNPLNFVNNFSEVSSELVDEMNEEIDKGNLTDAKEIANDLKQNLEKINHHGKRAGDIVKGMLQHSRSSSGVKEPIDINALADEYLRLAYHGLRAKDKTFNAIMKTDYDESIGKINVIPQDIGRVILNLINNAFYAVTTPQPSRQDGTGSKGGEGKPSENHEPTIWITTKKDGNIVLISVKDNGNGIPPKIFDKIFQPFFTTKPTGQGTGLGLSLSYDIVKAHGGELKVETEEAKGSTFIIQLPTN